MDSQDTDFEAWARMLIARKVPADCERFINSEVVRSGSEILRHGQGFEVHLLDAESGSSSFPGAPHVSVRRITVTPLVSRARRSL